MLGRLRITIAQSSG